MHNTRNIISRRTALRGAGALLALPFLEKFPLTSMAATEGAKAAGPPLRMGIFSTAGGTVLESFTPKEVGALTRLPSILRPLESVKNDLIVITGLSQGGRCDGVNAHEHCAFTHLTGSDYVKREGGRMFSSISVDQAAAKVVGRETFLPSMEIGLNNNQYSFSSPEVVVPYEANPRLIFNRMFRGRTPVVPNWAARQKATPRSTPSATLPASSTADDQSVIDLVLAQAKDLRRGLGKADQTKLDAYLDSVRSVENRLAFIESRHQLELADLASPGPSKLHMPDGLPREGLPIWKITQPLDQDPNKHADYIALMADLMILAFQTDTTRVCTFAAGSDESMFPGVVTVGYERHCHTLEHQGNSGNLENVDPISREACRQIHQWYTTLFAAMVQKMKAIDEGGSSLLDNTMLLYTSYMADGGHGQTSYPMVLAGNAQKTLKTGQHIRFEKQAPTSNLYVEMLNRMGVPTQSFGDSEVSTHAGSFKSRLPGLA